MEDYIKINGTTIKLAIGRTYETKQITCTINKELLLNFDKLNKNLHRSRGLGIDTLISMLDNEDFRNEYIKRIKQY